jgi:ubiquitin carboxyl-terminal hydrolase 16
MPDKPLTVITYAASASLAAIALVYFFNPNFLIDGDPSTSTASTRKKGIVGLLNPANDCFINSVLQSLAGLRDVRLYLIRELHRRNLDNADIYSVVPEMGKNGKPVNAKKLLSLQSGEVTQGLKDMLDGLNERPIYKKTISAASFIAVLEHAFGTRISKSQQDAQELLQLVAERLSEEYHAGREARSRAHKRRLGPIFDVKPDGLGVSVAGHSPTGPADAPTEAASHKPTTAAVEEEDGFPLEGRTESQIECQFCHFVPKANAVTFVMLTLTVPQKTSTTLNQCFDAHFKTEYIDDYKCDRCRLQSAIEVFSKDLSQAVRVDEKKVIQEKINKVRQALAENPENPPDGVELPDIKFVPTRRIARHVQITSFPKVLVIHLSRSIYEPSSSSTKNAAKVSFPEQLPLGSLLNRRTYKLLGMVTHKGTHNSGHYESFRRQHLYAPFSTPHLLCSTGPYSAEPTTPPSPASPGPTIYPNIMHEAESTEGHLPSSLPVALLSPSTISSSPSLESASISAPSTRPSSGSVTGSALNKRDSVPSHRHLQDAIEGNLKPDDSHSVAESSVLETSSKNDESHSAAASSLRKMSASLDPTRLRRKKKTSDRWWRISDDKIKECKTSDVLSMQKEVYMLFYEMEKE